MLTHLVVLVVADAVFAGGQQCGDSGILVRLYPDRIHVMFVRRFKP
jgi:hypothetical protein